MNKDMIKTKDYMEQVFVPSLHKMISDINPVKYRMWNKNLCRQTAVFGAYILSGLHKDIDWQVWDGVFEDIHLGEKVRYNHAWIFGKDKSGTRYLIDLSRNTKERLFIEVQSNGYPKDHPEYKDMKEITRERLDWKSMFYNENEYNTGLKGPDFIKVLNIYIKKEILNLSKAV